MRSRPLLSITAGALLLGLFQGCGGVDDFPLNPFVDLEQRADQGLDGTAGSVTLPVESIRPQETRIGEILTIFGQGREFPAGFARFVFTGNATIEVALPQATSEIQVRIPSGTISGAFGFVISQQSTLSGQGNNGNFTGPAPQSFKVLHPGVRILGPAEPPGGLPGGF